MKIKNLLLALLMITAIASVQGKTLVAYYSYTGNCKAIVNELTNHITADVLEIQPAEKGLKYEADNYALGTQLLNDIKANPNETSSYPAIDPVNISIGNYQNIIIVTPLWWSQMAAPMQTFLFNYGTQMQNKSIGLIVSSASSGISQVVADCRRLVPDATWMGDPLWINNSNRSRTTSIVREWLATLNFQNAMETPDMYITIGGKSQRLTLTDNNATRALLTKLQDGNLNITLNSSGDFEIWGPLGFSLPTDNRQMTTQPGDVVLYNASNICLFYGANSWSYTPLGKIEGLSEDELRSFLKAGESNISVTLSLSYDTTAINDVSRNRTNAEGGANNAYMLNGLPASGSYKGILIKDGKKFIK